MDLLEKFNHVESMKRENTKVFLSRSLSDDSVENYVAYKLGSFNIDYFNMRNFSRHNLSLDFSMFYKTLSKFFEIQSDLSMKWGSVDVTPETIDLYLEGSIKVKKFSDSYKKNVQSLYLTEFVDDFKIFTKNGVSKGINLRAQCSLNIEKYISYILEIDEVKKSSHVDQINPSITRRSIDV